MDTTFNKTTESDSTYNYLDQMEVETILESMNREDQSVPLAVQKAIPVIKQVVIEVVTRLKQGGRLFYIGAGTSGRLGVVDASECPPTFGVPFYLVIGLIAGGDTAIRKAVEFAEDDTEQGWKDLQEFEISSKDVVIGIAASGTTPYVISAVQKASENGIFTSCITCNSDSPLSKAVEVPIEVVVGPEFLTGSSRLKAGTAQKLVLNMISTATMIQLGRVKGNQMVDMQLSNDKLIDRGTKMVVQATHLSYDEAKALLLEKGSVRASIDAVKDNPIHYGK